MASSGSISTTVTTGSVPGAVPTNVPYAPALYGAYVAPQYSDEATAAAVQANGHIQVLTGPPTFVPFDAKVMGQNGGLMVSVDGGGTEQHSSGSVSSGSDGDGNQAEMPADATPAQVKEQLKQQIEFYFSRENLARDKYMTEELMDQDQYVALEALLKFPRVKKITVDMDFLTEALRDSEFLQLDNDEKRVRVRPRSRSTIIMREIPDNTPKEELEALFAKDACPAKPVSIAFVSNGSWYVNFDDESEAIQALNYLRTDVIEFLGNPIKARMKATNSQMPPAPPPGAVPAQQQFPAQRRSRIGYPPSGEPSPIIPAAVSPVGLVQPLQASATPPLTNVQAPTVSGAPVIPSAIPTPPPSVSSGTGSSMSANAPNMNQSVGAQSSTSTTPTPQQPIPVSQAHVLPVGPTGPMFYPWAGAYGGQHYFPGQPFPIFPAGQPVPVSSTASTSTAGQTVQTLFYQQPAVMLAIQQQQQLLHHQQQQQQSQTSQTQTTSVSQSQTQSQTGSQSPGQVTWSQPQTQQSSSSSGSETTTLNQPQLPVFSQAPPASVGGPRMFAPGSQQGQRPPFPVLSPILGNYAAAAAVMQQMLTAQQHGLPQQQLNVQMISQQTPASGAGYQTTQNQGGRSAVVSGMLY